jgi:quercetin dioxygenase-like cupin family protein
MDYPKRIDNGGGEVLVFERLERTADGPCLIVSNEVQPGAGPPMHIHHRQEESLTVVSGRLGYEIQGETPHVVGPGETMTFAPGIAHRFWAEGDEVLRCTGTIRPPDNVAYFLTEIYASTQRNGGTKPDDLEAAYLMHKYRREFDMTEIPGFVKGVIFPILRTIGHLTGRYARYRNGPDPIA